jgi:D-alanyl-lipoteichoic acid acyltransferase DltB (MBOAT superfamily)
MHPALLISGIVVYIALARFTMKWLGGTVREIVFACLNLAGFYFLFVKTHDRFHTELFLIYFLSVVGMYLVMRLCLFPETGGWKLWLAFMTPILVLIAVRYMPPPVYAGFIDKIRGEFFTGPDFTIAPYFVGLSYLAFRCSYLVLEVRNGAVEKPGFWDYLGFAFFVPTIPVGPISTYSNYRRGFAAVSPDDLPGRSSLRILVGLVKYLFLGNVFNQLTYSGLLLDDHYHSWIDLPVAMVFYYLYLYCNFSGFCDMAIGAAGLIGIPVPENFQDPFAARNMREFWNRWHITLSQWMRDVVFSPLSKYLARVMGPSQVNQAVAVTIFVVFLLIGIWHGAGWNYAVFGLLQGVGVVTTHYYTIGLKKWLGRDGFKAYNSNRWIQAIAVVITFCFFSATLFFFANSPKDIKEIISALN